MSAALTFDFSGSSVTLTADSVTLLNPSNVDIVRNFCILKLN